MQILLQEGRSQIRALKEWRGTKLHKSLILVIAALMLLGAAAPHARADDKDEREDEEDGLIHTIAHLKASKSKTKSKTKTKTQGHSLHLHHHHGHHHHHPHPPKPTHHPKPECVCEGGSSLVCYTNDKECAANKNPFAASKVSQCVSGGRHVYSCLNEAGVCRSVTTCKKIESGSGTQDPHFMGFNGADYYFEGEAGRSYNIVSDRDVQVNAQFTRLHNLKGTYMGRVSILVGSHMIGFDPHFGAYIDGESLADGASIEMSNVDIMYEVVDARPRLTVRTPAWQFVARAKIEKGLVAESYINLHASVVGMPTDPHGILGQTARFLLEKRAPGSKPEQVRNFSVEGEEPDYELKDGLFGTDFTFNKFSPSLAGGEGGMRKEAVVLRASVRSTFEAGVDV
ncbi:hypothetical protein H696_01757 [Fonticula alba]|uniref:VWFD domain-containing protein n=1 Tax=Fonticula alba TaxID=691883 RepID=A0A058ZDA1_FONAL|nr:hypothetical protein H696_01757 [Fonticula alba]KCV72364.1 hypothetical protein H696_01757 [Fonticula alba]|eukprot:XP_009493942.1 hypothetical protein H696_01757 [Fonticula alba]